MTELPEQQVEAHRFCRQVNEDFAECALFDGNTATLPGDGRRFWHPHKGEILSGQLVAPGIPDAAGQVLMKKKMNSYGKTWHVWNTGFNGKPGDKLPLGPPMLAWSFNRDGAMHPNMLEERDTRMQIDTAAKRRKRAGVGQLAKPQSGVDELKGKFGRPTRDIPGVSDSRSSAPAAVP